jgi:IrrE N-terminal-like domain
MNRNLVESEVASLHREIWRRRADLRTGSADNPVALLCPRLVTTAIFGFEYESRASIEGDGSRGWHMPAGGFIDRRRGIICVSQHFPEEVQRFTAAHEIGHMVLHPNIGDSVVHRDIPVGLGAATARPWHEMEADYFAACFLMPRKLVTKAFVSRFGMNRLREDDEDVNFFLAAYGSKGFFSASGDRLAFGSAVARSESFSGRRFDSLAGCFGVSVRAMAIRLLELELLIPRAEERRAIVGPIDV